jgi:REP element-mobilizing transposase RayT
MTDTPVARDRRSIRLCGYDYSREGAYFVTICTQDRANRFGAVADGTMQLNDAGQMVARWWDELNRAYLGVETDAFVAMPDHIHGIVVLVGADQCVCPTDMADQRVCPDDNALGEHVGSPLPDSTQRGPARRATLPRVVQWFKTMTTNEYIRGVKQHRWPSFDGRLWQRNYHEHIIRDDDEMARIRRYIMNNPTHAHESAGPT